MNINVIFLAMGLMFIMIYNIRREIRVVIAIIKVRRNFFYLTGSGYIKELSIAVFKLALDISLTILMTLSAQGGVTFLITVTSMSIFLSWLIFSPTKASKKAVKIYREF